MSCCGGQELTPAERAEQKNSASIDQSVEQAQAQDQEVKKLLLLGAGESGKSTLFKQAIALYGKELTLEEKMTYVATIHNNIISNIKTLIQFSDQLRPPCPISAANAHHKAAIDQVAQVDSNGGAAKLNSAMAASITALWQDPGIQATYARRSEYQLNDSTDYFFGRLNDICQPSYVPSQQDILRSRARTTGIIETQFLIDGNTFKMFDVGGQRAERKKWIHCFEGVTAVLFVAAISEYDQKLFEDERQNRMLETLSLFAEIVNSKWFRKTSIILFLNKTDLFEEKLFRVPITVCPAFQHYDGPEHDFEATTDFIIDHFKSQLDSNNNSKQIYTHLTCATDTDTMKNVFQAVQDIIIRKSLEEAGLLG